MFGTLQDIFQPIMSKKKMLLTSIVSASNRTKCVLLSNEKRMTQATLINLHANEYSQELHYYALAVNLER